MGNLPLLLEYVKLVLEQGPDATPARAPFVIKGPVKKVGPNRWSRSDEYGIERDFPVVMPPEMLAALKVTPDELDPNGALPGEHEVVFTVDVYYRRSTFKGSRMQPPDPDEWEYQDWEPVVIDGFELSNEDAAALKAYLGDLTDDEIERVQERWFEQGHDEPDYPEPDDYDFDDRF